MSSSLASNLASMGFRPSKPHDVYSKVVLQRGNSFMLYLFADRARGQRFNG